MYFCILACTGDCTACDTSATDCTACSGGKFAHTDGMCYGETYIIMVTNELSLCLAN